MKDKRGVLLKFMSPTIKTKLTEYIHNINWNKI